MDSTNTCVKQTESVFCFCDNQTDESNYEVRLHLLPDL